MTFIHIYQLKFIWFFCFYFIYVALRKLTTPSQSRHDPHSKDSIAALAGPAFISQSSGNVVSASANHLPGLDDTNTSRSGSRSLRPSKSTGNIKTLSVRVSHGDGLLSEGMTWYINRNSKLYFN